MNDEIQGARVGRQAASVMRMATARERIRLKRLESELEGLRKGAVEALGLVLDFKNLKTGRYAAQLARWAQRAGEQLGLGARELLDLKTAALLYDVGKIGIPDRILLKPGELTDSEYEIVRKHPEYGWGILRAIPGFGSVALLVLHHHERFDGSGYPAGLAGEEIPLGSRILAVVDTLEAMLSSRPYRSRIPPGEVIARLRPHAGGQFDPRVVEEFARIAGWSLPELAALEHPPGSELRALEGSCRPSILRLPTRRGPRWNGSTSPRPGSRSPR